MTKDPISSLVEFAQDIKPYHTKIIEILVDYIYEETMNVEINDDMEMKIKTNMDFHSDFCPEGYGIPPWGEEYRRGLDATVDINAFPADSELFDGIDDTIAQIGHILTEFGTIFQVNKIVQPNLLYIPGDQTGAFPVDSVFSIVNTFNNDGTWKVSSAQYDSVTNQTIVGVEFFSNRTSLKMFAGFSSSWFPEGFLWIDPSNVFPYKRAQIYSGGWWHSFSGPTGLYPDPINDPSFIFDTVQPVGVNAGSYWFNTLTEVLSYFSGSVWTTIDSNDYYLGTDPYTLRAKRNIMYVTGKASNYFSAGQDFTIRNSTHFHNGKWMITKSCDEVNFSELTVQHVTDTTADGMIYTSLSVDPTPHWPSGLYWFNSVSSQLKIWDGGAWVVPTPTVTISVTAPIAPNTGDLWYHNIDQKLFEFGGLSWVEVDSDYVITGATPGPDTQGPRYSDDGFIIASNTPSYNISKVVALEQPLIVNDEYSTFTVVDGCNTLSGIPDPLSPSAIFYVSGEFTGDFVEGQNFIIQGSTGNDGVWKIYQISYDILSNSTLLTCLFESISTVDDQTTGMPNELFQTWDSVFGLGLGGFDLDLPLTSGQIDAYVLSNYDFPEICPFVSPTTAFTKIKETVETDITLPYHPISAMIISAAVSSSGSPGSFVIVNSSPCPSENEFCNNFEVFFTPGSEFLIQQSGNNNGLWTVASSYYNHTTKQTVVTPVENIPRILPELGGTPEVALPYGIIAAEMATFEDSIKVDIIENNLPSAWEFYYHSSPTSPIKTIDTGSNTITVDGDLRRFFSVGGKITIQQSKRSVSTYPFFEYVNEGAWVWTLGSKSYDSGLNHTVLTINEPLTNADLQTGNISSQPTWIRGVGWDQLGWSAEPNPWLRIANAQLTSGGDLTSIVNYDMFIPPHGQFDELYFDLGGVSDILQHVLPL